MEKLKEKVARKRIFKKEGLEKSKENGKKEKSKNACVTSREEKRGILTRINKRREHMFKVSGKYLH